MYSKIALAGALLLCPFHALAQNATATGTGVGIANSKSQSGAVAISGQGGRGGQGGTSSLTVNSNAPAATTATVNTHSSGDSTITERNVPSTFAPGLAAAGIETCLGSVSGGGSVVGTGVSFGTTVPDPGCAARLDARTLWGMGLKGAAVARLCLNPDIYRSMPDVCVRYMPVAEVPVAAVASSTLLQVTAATGGPIEVVEGKTGLTRLCDNYNETRHKCLQWNGVTAKPHHKPKKIAAMVPNPRPLPAPEAPKPAEPVTP